MANPSLQTILLIAAAGAAAQPPLSPNPANNNNSYGSNVHATFRPSIAVVIGIFATMFSLTLFLLMYGKFCHSNGATRFIANSNNISGARSISDNSRPSGIDKAVIESLPFFRFSALKGSREGLECSVCLSRFDDADVLRLLPRCKHAFHMDCIDQWLESHSSCPLCRVRVEVDDVALFKISSDSPEIVEASGDSGLELYIEREHASSNGGRSRRSFRWAERLRFGAVGKQAAPLHNFEHRILVSQVVFRSRWSDFNSSDLIGLGSEMLRAMSNRRVDLTDSDGGDRRSETILREEMERRRRLENMTVRMQMPVEEGSSEFSVGDMRALISPASRCMSDITVGRRNRPSESRGEKEEKVRRIWLPIARRTVQWFAGKEGRAMRLHGGGEREENV